MTTATVRKLVTRAGELAKLGYPIHPRIRDIAGLAYSSRNPALTRIEVSPCAALDDMKRHPWLLEPLHAQRWRQVKQATALPAPRQHKDAAAAALHRKAAAMRACRDIHLLSAIEALDCDAHLVKYAACRPGALPPWFSTVALANMR
jgi:hypothetical protein